MNVIKYLTTKQLKHKKHQNTCLLLRNHSKLNKTEAAFDKCSTKLGVLQNAIRQSIEPVLLIKERVFLVTLQAIILQLY